MLHITCLALLLASPLDSSPDPSIESVRNTYLAALTPIFTLDCEMHLTFEPVKGSPRQDPSDRYESAESHLWRKGTWRALRVDYTNGNHEPTFANWNGFDGSFYARWTKSLGPHEQQMGLPGGHLQVEKDNASYEAFTVDRLTGETLSAGDLPLGALLQDPGAKIVGRKDIAGVSCLEVSFPRHMVGRMFPELKTMETTAWLDPAHSYLPRLIRRQNFTSAGADPRQLHEFETTEFASLTGEDQQTYILPAAGEHRSFTTKARLKLVRATINGPLSDQLFKPEYPPLTEVLQKLPNQPPRTVISGDPAAHRRAHDEILERAVQKEYPPSVPVSAPSARPRDARGWRSSFWVQFLACSLCVSVLVVGVRMWRTRHR